MVSRGLSPEIINEIFQFREEIPLWNTTLNITLGNKK